MTESQFSRADQTKLLKGEFGELFDNLAALFYEADPMWLNEGDNSDVYEAELTTILLRLTPSCSLQDVENIVYSEFCSWFGDSESDPATVAVIGTREIYKPISATVWQMWNDYNEQKSVGK